MRPVFVGGCGRSGTTMLATLVARHSRIVAPPEAQFLVEGLARSHGDAGSFVGAIRGSWRLALWQLPDLTGHLDGLSRTAGSPGGVMSGLARAYAVAAGKAEADLWVDHTPLNVGYAETVLTAFPESRLIHVLRDPRAVVASVLPLDWGPSSAREGARWWLERLAMGLAAEAAFPDRVLRVRYEDVLADPASTLDRVCRFVGVALEPSMVTDEIGPASLPEYTRRQHALVGGTVDPSRAEAWRKTLSARDIALIEGEVRDTLPLVGYEPSGAVPALAAAASPAETVRAAARRVRQRWRHRARIRAGVAAARRSRPQP